MRRTVKGTILRNRPVFSGRYADGGAVTGAVAFSRPLRAGKRPHYRVEIALADGRVGRTYFTPGSPVTFSAGWPQ